MPEFSVLQNNCQIVGLKDIKRTNSFSHPGCLDLVSSAATPTFKIWQHLTFLTLHTGLHLAPPLLCYYRCYKDKNREKNEENNSISLAHLLLIAVETAISF